MTLPVTSEETQRDRAKRLRTERIIRAARDLLHEEPETELTIPRIARRADVAPMTIFNLIGTRDDLWAALADDALAGWRPASAKITNPRQRATKIVDEVVRVIASEAPLFRALASSWRDSGRVLESGPTRAIIECLEQAADEGVIADRKDVKRLGAMIFSGLVGILHQWSAGLVSDRAMRQRARDLVDIAFAAGREGVARP